MSPFLAHRVISARCRIWSLSGHSGLGRTCCWLDPVANNPFQPCERAARMERLSDAELMRIFSLNIGGLGGREERYLIVACTVITDVPEAVGP
jgi:hypothetical protein